MKGFIGVTSHEWWSYIKDRHIETVNFWNKKKTFTALKPGELFFFLKKNSVKESGERLVVGYGIFDHFEYLNAEEAWDKFENGNGFQNKETFLTSMNGILGDGDHSLIGCIILTNYITFETPVLLSKIGIDFQNAIVSGKGITEDECNKIINASKMEDKLSVGINIPQKPQSISYKDGVQVVTCGNCGYLFAKAARCPSCGQLIDYSS